MKKTILLTLLLFVCAALFAAPTTKHNITKKDNGQIEVSTYNDSVLIKPSINSALHFELDRNTNKVGVFVDGLRVVFDTYTNFSINGINVTKDNFDFLTDDFRPPSYVGGVTYMGQTSTLPTEGNKPGDMWLYNDQFAIWDGVIGQWDYTGEFGGGYYTIDESDAYFLRKDGVNQDIFGVKTFREGLYNTSPNTRPNTLAIYDAGRGVVSFDYGVIGQVITSKGTNELPEWASVDAYTQSYIDNLQADLEAAIGGKLDTAKLTAEAATRYAVDTQLDGKISALAAVEKADSATISARIDSLATVTATDSANIWAHVDNGFNATTATKLQTARNLRVDLTRTTSQAFDGSADATLIGINGILPLANGGVPTNTATQERGKILYSANPAIQGEKAYYDFIYLNNYGTIDNPLRGILPLSAGGTGGTSLKTINGESIVGTGNFVIADASTIYEKIKADSVAITDTMKIWRDSTLVKIGNVAGLVAAEASNRATAINQETQNRIAADTALAGKEKRDSSYLKQYIDAQIAALSTRIVNDSNRLIANTAALSARIGNDSVRLNNTNTTVSNLTNTVSNNYNDLNRRTMQTSNTSNRYQYVLMDWYGAGGSGDREMIVTVNNGQANKETIHLGIKDGGIRCYNVFAALYNGVKYAVDATNTNKIWFDCGADVRAMGVIPFCGYINSLGSSATEPAIAAAGWTLARAVNGNVDVEGQPNSFFYVKSLKASNTAFVPGVTFTGMTPVTIYNCDLFIIGGCMMLAADINFNATAAVTITINFDDLNDTNLDPYLSQFKAYTEGVMSCQTVPSDTGGSTIPYECGYNANTRIYSFSTLAPGGTPASGRWHWK